MMINGIKLMCFESVLICKMTTESVDGQILDSNFQHLAKNELQMRNDIGELCSFAVSAIMILCSKSHDLYEVNCERVMATKTVVC